MKTLIFTATYNEIDNIEVLCKEIHYLHPNFDILVVDDNSPDGTSELVSNLREEIPCLTLINRPAKLGLGTAHQLGMLYAIENSYDRLVTLDADLSHAPTDICRLLDGLENADFVIGSRYMPGGKCDYKGYRLYISRLANMAARLLLGIHLHEFTTSFRAFRVDVLRMLDYAKLQTRGYSFFMESIVSLSQTEARVMEVPIVFRDRFGGESKIPKYEIFRGMYKLLLLFLVRASGIRGERNVLPEAEACQLCDSIFQIELFPDTTLIGRTQNTTLQNDAAAYRCTSFEHNDNPRILKCLVCGLVHVPRSAQRDDLDQLYESVEDTQYLENTKSRERTFAEAYRRISPFIGESPGRLVEIGAYCGIFISECQKHGWDCDGIEPSSWAVTYARQKYGIELLAGTLADNVDERTNLYDLVASWDVLEHVKDPVDFLRQANRMLKPGGYICLSTLDYDNWFPKLAGRRWPWLMDMHLFYFSPDLLAQMFEKAGFELVHVDKYVHYATLKYLFRKIGSLPLYGFDKIISLFIPVIPSSIMVPVSFGDIKLFIGRKRPCNIINVSTDNPLEDMEGS
jgi:2-polyprenyl-3-methyl-5-hydroxy-6-metoxy-1,4-benzoquinol methylase